MYKLKPLLPSNVWGVGVLALPAWREGRYRVDVHWSSLDPGITEITTPQPKQGPMYWNSTD